MGLDYPCAFLHNSFYAKGKVPVNRPFKIAFLAWLKPVLAACMLFAWLGPVTGAENGTRSAALLRARFAELGQQLSKNQFNRPLYLDSSESSNQLKADIYALVDYPFAAVSESFIDPARWCDMLILHLNTKYCHASTGQTPVFITVSMGKKTYEELNQAYPVEFTFSLKTSTPEYFDIRLIASKGPLGTSDYSIMLESVSLPDGKTFLHLSYAYAYGFMGRIAMQAYLATAGRGKFGFTRSDRQGNGQPVYIDGMRAAVERNTMRYYLSIDAYLSALSAPEPEQFEKRVQSWFTATEVYSRQLHELDRWAYLEMKRREYQRMRQSP
jgi:hypothetical protein